MTGFSEASVTVLYWSESTPMARAFLALAASKTPVPEPPAAG